MKKTITFFLIFISLTFTSFASKDINEIKTLRMSIKEIGYMTNKKIEKAYNIVYSSPSSIKKIMLEPKSHKGETFIYKDGTKTVYLPIFNKTYIEEDSSDEHVMIDLFRFFQDNYKKNKEFKKFYSTKNSFKVKKENLNIEIIKMSEINDFRIPTKLKIYDGEILLLDLSVNYAKVNDIVPESEFSLDDKTN